jgi:hypothetical protein
LFIRNFLACFSILIQRILANPSHFSIFLQSVTIAHNFPDGFEFGFSTGVPALVESLQTPGKLHLSNNVPSELGGRMVVVK